MTAAPDRATVEGLMELVDRFGSDRWATGFSEGAKPLHYARAESCDSNALKRRAAIESYASRLTSPAGERAATALQKLLAVYDDEPMSSSPRRMAWVNRWNEALSCARAIEREVSAPPAMTDERQRAILEQTDAVRHIAQRLAEDGWSKSAEIILDAMRAIERDVSAPPAPQISEDEITDIESAFDYVFGFAGDPKDGHIAQTLCDRLQGLTKRLRRAPPEPDEPPRGTDAQILKERELTASAISGAMAFGYQGTNPPPEPDHWLAEFWEIGRRQRELESAAPSAPQAVEADKLLDWVFENCKVVFYPSGGEYPIEHNPFALGRVDEKAAILLRAAASTKEPL